MKLILYKNILLILIFTFNITDIYSKNSSESALNEGETILNNDGTKTISVKSISFTWKLDDDFLYGVLESSHTGWVAIGIGPKNMMEGADFIIGYVLNGTVYIRDDYGNWLTSHVSDKDLGGTNDIEIIGGSETDSSTRIEFKKRLNSTDVFDNVIEPGVETVVIFAAGINDDFYSMHTVKAKGVITF